MQATTYHRLSLQEREEKSRGFAAGLSQNQIALALGRGPSTVSRELTRLRYRPPNYRAVFAEEVAIGKRNHRTTHKLLTNDRLRAYVETKLLVEHWSPQQRAARMKLEYPNDMDMHVSHETIYTYIFCLARGSLKKELKAALRQHKYQRGRLPEKRADSTAADSRFRPDHDLTARYAKPD